MTYQHLSQAERYQIYILMKDGKTQSQIATLMDRHKSTISRELARNTGLKGYRPKQVPASRGAFLRLSQCSPNQSQRLGYGGDLPA
jgi:IS30 family transposase